MVTEVIAAIARILVVPLSVVNGDLHLRWIAIVQAIAAAIVFASPEVLRIIDVRIVVEAAVVSIAGRSSPLLPVGVLLCTYIAGQAYPAHAAAKHPQK